MRYDTIVLDSDGVLTDLTPRDLQVRAIREVLASFGVDDPDAETVEALFAVTPESLASICDRHELDASTFWAERDRLLAERQCAAIERGEKPLYPDVRALWELDATLAVVSNNQQETIDFVLEHFELDSLIEVAYGRPPTLGAIARKKPDPHYLQQVLEEVDATSALYVGDSESDVLAAHNAGIDSAFVRRSHRETYRLSVGPTHEISSLDELPALVEG